MRASGVIGMDAAHAEALAAFRSFNYESIYLRGPVPPAGVASVVAMLRALVEYFARHPQLIPDVADGAACPTTRAPRCDDAVAYVAGMTDRFACRSAVALLDWPIDHLPTASTARAVVALCGVERRRRSALHPLEALLGHADRRALVR